MQNKTTPTYQQISQAIGLMIKNYKQTFVLLQKYDEGSVSIPEELVNNGDLRDTLLQTGPVLRRDYK